MVGRCLCIGMPGGVRAGGLRPHCSYQQNRSGVDEVLSRELEHEQRGFVRGVQVIQQHQARCQLRRSSQHPRHRIE